MNEFTVNRTTYVVDIVRIIPPAGRFQFEAKVTLSESNEAQPTDKQKDFVGMSAMGATKEEAVLKLEQYVREGSKKIV